MIINMLASCQLVKNVIKDSLPVQVSHPDIERSEIVGKGSL
jgi:hypothetical protein